MIAETTLHHLLLTSAVSDHTHMHSLFLSLFCVCFQTAFELNKATKMVGSGSSKKRPLYREDDKIKIFIQGPVS